MTLVAVAGLTLLVAGVTAGVVLAGRDDPRPAGPYTTWEERPWIVGGISADQRTLTLSYVAGGCTDDRGRTEFHETHAEVRVSKLESREMHNVYCLLSEKGGQATIHLRLPLNGRPVGGDATHRRTPLVPTRAFARGDTVFVRVPRVAGLNGRQARRLMRAAGFASEPLSRARTTAKVAGTQPRYSTPVPYHPNGRAVELVFRD